MATLHFNCARAALKQGRHVLALEQAEAALALRDDYANARMLQAECAMELLEFDLAVSAYGALATLEPHNPAWGECEAKAREMSRLNAYDVLGLPRAADAAAVRRAYHSQCLQWHPDKHQGSDEALRRANTMFKRVTAAHELLSDEVRRAEYNMQLHMSDHGRGGGSGAQSPESSDPGGRRGSCGSYSSEARRRATATSPAASAYRRDGGGRSSYGGQENAYEYGDVLGAKTREFARRWSRRAAAHAFDGTDANSAF